MASGGLNGVESLPYTFVPSFPAGCQDAFEIMGWKKNKNRENLEEEIELINR